MAGETNTPASGSGDGSAAGSGQAASAQGPDGGGNPGNTPAVSGGGIDRTKLNPLIAGMNEEQMNEVFDTLFNAARNQNAGVPQHAQQVQEPAAPKIPDKESLREYFDPTSDKFDPMAVIGQVVEANYGGLLGDINKRALSGVEVAMRQQFTDFDKYKADIDQILAGRPATTISQQDYLAAYYMAKGARATEAEVRERQKPPTTATPSPQAIEPVVDPRDVLSPTEKEVAAIMFRGEADPEAAFRAARARATGGVTKVPGDKK